MRAKIKHIQHTWRMRVDSTGLVALEFAFVGEKAQRVLANEEPIDEPAREVFFWVR
jgi:hypothetical protein